MNFRSKELEKTIASLVDSFECSATLKEKKDFSSHQQQDCEAAAISNFEKLPSTLQRQRKLLLIGDSIIKYIDANRLMHTRKNYKFCLPGATIETIENILINTYKHLNHDIVTDVLVHVGTNNIPQDHFNIVINSVARLLHTVQKLFPQSDIYFSGIIPKYSNAYIGVTDKINYAVRNWCRANGYHFIDTRGLFVNSKHRIRFDRLSKNDRLHLNRAGVQALAKYFTFYLNTLYGKMNFTSC